MLYDALGHVAAAIRSCEEALDARNLPRGVDDAIRRAEHELADAAGALAADLAAVTADLPHEVERQSVADMVRSALERAGQSPPD